MTRVEEFKNLIHDKLLNTKEIFAALSVEYRDEIAMMHIKTLGKEDAEMLVEDCFRAAKKKSKKRSKKSNRRKNNRRKNKP